MTVTSCPALDAVEQRVCHNEERLGAVVMRFSGCVWDSLVFSSAHGEAEGCRGKKEEGEMC